MEIRPLRLSDDPAAVSRVYEESWKRAYRGIVPDAYLDSIPSGAWCPALNTPGRWTLLLLDDDRIVGTSSYSASRSERMAGFGEVISLYLLPDFCGKGYGRSLLQAAVDDLHSRGYRDIFLWVLEENVVARRFYERFGFSCSGIFTQTEIGGKTLREVAYVCHMM